MKIAAEQGEKVSSKSMPDFAEKAFCNLKLLSKSFHFPRRFCQKAALDILTHKLTKIKAELSATAVHFRSSAYKSRDAAAAGSASGAARKTPLAPEEWAQQVNCHSPVIHSASLWRITA
jgi:hypothetical protein